MTGKGHPGPLHDALIRAGTAHDTQTAMNYWSKALSLQPLDSFDAAAVRLLPLVQHRLADVESVPQRDVLAARHRRAWMNNLRLLAGIQPVIDAFSAADIACVLLKGAALCQTVYPSLGTRPVGDIDVLVPPGRAQDAIEILRSRGFRTPSKFEFGPDTLAPYHGIGFLSPAGWWFDLHWRLSYEERNGTDGDLWSRLLPGPHVAGRGVGTFVLDPTDQFLHTLVHGMRWQAVAPCRWIVDALLIVRSHRDEIDGARVIESARRRGALSAVLDAMEVLGQYGVDSSGLLGPRPPKPSATDRLAQHVRTSPPTRRSAAVRLLVVDYAYRTHSASLRRRIAGYPGYVMATAEAESIRRLGSNSLRLLRFGVAEKPVITQELRARTGQADLW